MNIVILNGSPSGANSITLQTVLYIERFFPEHTFHILQVGPGIRRMERDFSDCKAALEEADLIVFCYPVYTFLVPAQLHRFIELMKEHQVSLDGKAATQISTSKHFYDITAHRFIQENCEDMGLSYIRGLSADMEDLLTEKGRQEAIAFFRFVCWSMEDKIFEPVISIAGAERDAAKPSLHDAKEDPEPELQDPGAQSLSKTETSEAKDEARIVVVTDMDTGIDADDMELVRMIRCFQSQCSGQVDVVNLREFPFAGGCLGCFHCAADGTCVYKDGFTEYLRDHIQSADAIVYAFTIRDHSMGYRFKLYDDRQFCNGHRTVTMGKPVGYLVNGDLQRETNLRTLMEARAEVGGNFLAGIAVNAPAAEDLAVQINRLAKTLQYAIRNHFQMPKNFYGVGGLKIFRDLIYQMRGLMKEDHRFYKKHGFYDFPQKRKGMTMAMYLVGGMMKNKKLRKKMGNKMTEGMLMPYKKVMKNEQANRNC